MPALPPGSTVRVGDRDVPAEQVSEAVGAAARNDVLRAGLVAFPLVVVAAAVVSWVLVGRVLGPLHAVTATARRLSAESLDTRTGLRDARGEVAELAAGFDAMLDRLQAAFDAQRRFVANASHELRTPLSVLRTEVEVTLADPDADVDELRRMGAVVRDATRRADELVAGLLLLARTEGAALADVRAGGPGRRRRGRRWPRSAPRPAGRGLRMQVQHRPGADPRATRCCWSGWPATCWRTRCGTTSTGGWVEVVHRGRGRGAAELRVASSGPEIPGGPGGGAVRAVPPRAGGPHRRGPRLRLGLSIVRAVVHARTAARCTPSRCPAAA